MKIHVIICVFWLDLRGVLQQEDLRVGRTNLLIIWDPLEESIRILVLARVVQVVMGRSSRVRAIVRDTFREVDGVSNANRGGLVSEVNLGVVGPRLLVVEGVMGVVRGLTKSLLPQLLV